MPIHLTVDIASYILYVRGKSNNYLPKTCLFSKTSSNLTPKSQRLAFNSRIRTATSSISHFGVDVAPHTPTLPTSSGNGSVIYGSYLSKSEDIPSSARNVAVFDTIAALLAAVVIIPAMAVVLGEGISDVSGGPGLMFVYLVNVFNAMPAGRIIGAIFYICVLFAGVSSIVNLYEAPIAFLQEQFKFKRAAAVGTIGVIGLVVSIAIQPWTSQWMDVVSIYICPLGALLAGIMFFWVAGKKFVLGEVNDGLQKPIGGWFYPLAKYVYCILCIVALVAGAALGGIG